MTSLSRFAKPFTVRLRDDVRRLDGGSLLVGGSPLRVVRLSERAQTLLSDGRLAVDDEASVGLAGRLLDGNLADPCPSPVHRATVDQLTVVVPVRDRPDQLERCLTALAPLSCIVVDDASRDPAATRAVAERHGARCVLLDENVGPAGARNAGLREVATPYVAFVDSDVSADPATLVALTAHFADERVAMVGPRVRGVVRTARPGRVAKHDAATSSLDMGARAASVRSGSRVGWLPSACVVARSDRLGRGFDPDMRVGEDVDLVWRLGQDGYSVRYDPTHVVEHDARTTVLQWLERKFAYGTSGALLAARHGDLVAPAELSAPFAIAAALILARHPVAVPIGLAVVSHGVVKVAQRLPATRWRAGLALSLVLQGLTSAVEQESALILRHWWPMAVIGAGASRWARRAVVTALLVDLGVSVRDHPELGPWSHVVLRRLEDVAYGSGLGCGALRARDLRCLLPRRPSRARQPKRE